MKGLTIIYYDYEPAIGVNATCPDWGVEWEDRNDHFKSWEQFCEYLQNEYGSAYQLIEITPENYDQLCAEGVFGEI